MPNHDCQYFGEILTLETSLLKTMLNWSSINSCITNTPIIGHYNSSVRIMTWLLKPLMLCILIFIHKWRGVQFNVDTERRCFDKLIMAILLKFFY